jgi:hypothetical protein
MRSNNPDFLTCFLLLLLGAVIGILLVLVVTGGASLRDGNATQGIPIHDIELTEDGLTLTFYIGNQQWQATMKEAVSRPPNMSAAITMFIEGDELLFLNSESKNIFGETLHYVDSLRVLEG